MRTEFSSELIFDENYSQTGLPSKEQLAIIENPAWYTFSKVSAPLN